MSYVEGNDVIEPTSWNEIQGMNNPKEKENWLKDTQAETNSLMKRNIWELVYPPPNKKVIGSKWTFKRNETVPGTFKNLKNVW